MLRIPRQPDLLVGFTIQPVMFVLLFVYVFGGAIEGRSSSARPAGNDIWLSVAWSVGIALVFGIPAVWRYRRVITR